MTLPLIFLYILPAILSIITICSKTKIITRGDLLLVILISMVPIFNIVMGYIAWLVVLLESKAVNNFLNKRIK
jgi:hypothetical protein